MNHFEGDNIGSIAGFQIAAHYNFSSFNPIGFLAGINWETILFKEQSGQFKEDVQESENGLVCTYSGRIFIHNMRDEVDDLMDKYLGQVSVIRLIDMNGRVYIIGAPGMPVTLSSAGDTGLAYINENGKEIQFKIEQPFRALRV